MDKPQEGWLGMLSALYLQRDEFKEAVPVLQQLISVAPEKKTYWMQLSSIYGQMEDYPNALAIMQLAYSAGLVTEDSEIRRLADLLLFNDVPYRGAQVLEAAIEKKIVNARRQALREARELLDRGRRVRQVDAAAAARRRDVGDGRHLRPSGRGAGAARGLGRGDRRAFSAASTRASSRTRAMRS